MVYKCNKKQLEYQKEYYKKNKERFVARQREKRKRLREWFREEIVAKVSCKECGENHPATIDFHHRDPSTKEGGVTTLLGSKFSKKKVIEELKKCDVLCSNCHRKHHWKERQNL